MTYIKPLTKILIFIIRHLSVGSKALFFLKVHNSSVAIGF